jgi:crotonobetainyl-CoA:carnitine CoA-transferase CaiB-like acyl-CoA transferase
VQFSDGTDEFREPAPALGEHTEEILSHVGYQPDELEKLKRNDVI